MLKIVKFILIFTARQHSLLCRAQYQKILRCFHLMFLTAEF